jgi:glycosyltransferase involved in cell wall biosynthesis
MQRVAVVIPCFNDGKLLPETLTSLQEPEPLEVVVVDDASTDPHTRDVLAKVERSGTRVMRHEVNQHLSAARMTGVAATSAPYVFNLDSDDHAVPGALSALADLLDADPGAAVASGDYEEFGSHELLRAIPDALDPYRVAYVNEYPPCALFRRSALLAAGGWRVGLHGYEDWDLWMSLAQADERMVRLAPGRPTYRRRVHEGRMLLDVRRRHVELYRDLRASHAGLFNEIGRHRRASPMAWRRKLLYPLVYGGRPRTTVELRVKRWLDDHHVWTLRR